MTFPVLEPGYRYVQGGDLFSKLLLLSTSRKEQEESLLFITSDLTLQKKYHILAWEQHIELKKLETYEDLHILSSSKEMLFSVPAEDLQYPVFLKEIEKKILLETGKNYDTDALVKQFHDFWYEYHPYEKVGSFMKKGDTFTLFFENGVSLQISFWGDELESLRYNGGEIPFFSLYSKKKLSESLQGKSLTLFEFLEQKNIFCVLDGLEFQDISESLFQKFQKVSSFEVLAWNSQIRAAKKNAGIQGIICSQLEDLLPYFRGTKRIEIYTKHHSSIERFLRDNHFENAIVKSVKSHLYKSFETQDAVFLCDDILSQIFIKKRLKKKLSQDLDLLLKIQNGDYIVHIDHGVGIFQGIVKKSLSGFEKEYLEIHYKGDEKLFVPVQEIARVSKYIGSENPELTGLSWKMWEKKMKKIREDIQEIAEELLKNFAERKTRSGQNYTKDFEKIQAFQGSFPYDYTPDQHEAIEAIFEDMCSDKNMDRLLVGDVGFWKTEVAFQAAYLALLNKKQVLLLSPLVVLAHEHYAKAQERFLGLWIKIWLLTRLQTASESRRVIEWLANGSIDMVIGTHKVLSEKLICKRLWLMIVDEEHKFWVVDKEKIKTLRSDIDILSLSATPIPRSLNLALSWVRDISLLKTPPLGRKSIETLVSHFDEKVILEAWNREFERGGQIFFVHNRVGNIEVLQKMLEKLFPKKKIIITHGQLPGDELEDRILAFKEKKYDILLSTTVIENGIDFSNVNTIFINECQSFGISQIHQLRGRVGRSEKQGYCYLLYRKQELDSEAAKRIQTIVDYSYLGAGFELAMKDLEIRGGGDILGVRQSGQAREIGMSLFLKMLEEKIEDLRHDWENAPWELPSKVQIDLPLSMVLSDEYFLNETDKLQFYREIEMVSDIADLDTLKEQFEVKEQSWDFDRALSTLFLVLECQILARDFKITALRKIGLNYQIEFANDMNIDALKRFLLLDSETKFQVLEIKKLRTPTKLFENDEKFLKYLLRMFQGNSLVKKIKLVKPRSPRIS